MNKYFFITLIIVGYLLLAFSQKNVSENKAATVDPAKAKEGVANEPAVNSQVKRRQDQLKSDNKKAKPAGPAKALSLLWVHPGNAAVIYIPSNYQTKTD